MMMKKILYIIFILLLNSCYTDYKEIDIKKDNKVEIILNLNVPEQQRTRAQLSNADETSISNIRVFVFDANDKFKYEAKIASSVTPTTSTDPLYQGKGSLKVRLIKSTGDEKYKIVVIANIASDDDVPTLTVGASTYENLRDGLKFKSIQDYSARKLPMWGENTIKIEENKAISLDMLRALARVDVGLDFDAYPSDNAKGLGNSFSLKTVDVYNVNEKGYYIPASANITSNAATNPTIPTGLGTAKTYTYGDDATATNSIVRDIYISESNNKGQTDESKKTYIVIGGNYAESTDITYYRLDFIGADGTEVLDVLRNYRYRFDIKKIGGSGYATKPEAASNSNINKIDAVLSVWDESQGNPTARGSSRMVKYHQSYMLGIDTDKFTLFKEQGSEGSIMARTNWNDGWTAKVTEGGDWLKITAKTGSTNVDTALKFKTTSENTTGSSRIGKIRVSAGALLFWDIEVTQGITPEVRLEILDEDTNEPISFFEVASTGIDMNSPKKIKLRWIPSDVNAVIKSQTAINADGSNKSNFTLAPEVKSINGRYAEQIYNLTAANLNAPFDEKNLNVEFMLEKDGVLEEKTLLIHQQNYNVLVYDDISTDVNTQLTTKLPNANDTKRYFMDGRDATIRIFANTPYRLEMIKNTSVMPNAPTEAKVIKDYATSTHLGQDGKLDIPNFSNGGGERVILKTIDDIKKTAGQSLLGYAKFKITSIENKFIPKEFNVIFRSGKIQKDANSFIVKMLPLDAPTELVNTLAKDAIPILIPLKRLVDAGRLTTEVLNQLISSGELKPKIYWSGSYTPGHNIIDEMEVVRSTTTETSYLSIKPGKSQGNAVVGVKQAEVAGALWSWHIWKLDNDQRAIGSDINTPIKGGFMDRNLGAIYYGEKGGSWACGLYYQWGRKDPFVSHHSYGSVIQDKSTVYYNDNYADDSNNMSARSFGHTEDYPYKNNQAQSLETAIKNPHILYYNNSDWYSPGDGNLWREDEKTIYDPCPYGWKVPSETQLSVLKDASRRKGTPTKGHQFTDYGFWPYSGYINDQNGKFQGYNRSGSFTSGDGEYLSSKSSTTTTIIGDIYHKATVFYLYKFWKAYHYGNITEEYGRARAMSVRCVRYEAESNTSSLDTSNGNDY